MTGETKGVSWVIQGVAKGYVVKVNGSYVEYLCGVEVYAGGEYEFVGFEELRHRAAFRSIKQARRKAKKWARWEAKRIEREAYREEGSL
jgi:hypothetical protein